MDLISLAAWASKIPISPDFPEIARDLAVGFCMALSMNSVAIPVGFSGQFQLFRENLGSSGASGGSLHRGASFNVEKAHSAA